ncbi:TPOR protein, partial [Crypturellus soui]|nr:TPOR protein [Crypturellus soui]
DAALLEGVPEDILCFSRSFEDLTCFWDEEKEEEANGGKCRFYYWYSGEKPKACAVSTQSRRAGGTWHVCAFPSQDVRLFSQLSILVVNTTSNQTKYSRELSVDAVGESPPPPAAPRRPPLRELQPPQELGKYVEARAAQGSGPWLLLSLTPLLQDLVQTDSWVLLRELRPGARYHIQVRSKPDGLSVDGVWGPWSQAVAAETPRSS